MKKLLSFLMAALLLVGVCTAAVAENEGSITIQNATAGQTYAIYKVFDATYSGTNISYTYTKTGESDALFAALTDTEDALNPLFLPRPLLKMFTMSPSMQMQRLRLSVNG